MRDRQKLGSHGVPLALVCMALIGVGGAARAQTRAEHSPLVLAGVGSGTWDMQGSSIGIEIGELADNDATNEGAFVNAVRDGSPAESAGFAEGDVVVAFNGERIRGVQQLTRVVRETPVGRTVEATVLRDGSRVALQVTPEPSGPPTPFMPDSMRSGRVRVGGHALNVDLDALRPSGRARLGVAVQAMSSQLADYFGVDSGLLVSSVEEGSVAAAAGVMAGDVITAVDGRAIDSADMLRRRLSGLDAGDEVSIGVTREGRELTLTATLAGERNGSCFSGRAIRRPSELGAQVRLAVGLGGRCGLGFRGRVTTR